MNKELSVAVNIESKIFLLRGKNVMLDRDLAALYGVPVKALNQAVKRNIRRFPPDFMFQLTIEEAELLRSQFVTLNDDGGGKKRGQNIKYLPYAFTEQGVAMLSGVLNSGRAVNVNIQIMRAFVKMKEYFLKMQNDDKVISRLGVLEKALLNYMASNDKRVDDIIAVLNAMIEKEEKPSKKIGFIK